jgi:hypothetical protein
VPHHAEHDARDLDRQILVDGSRTDGGESTMKVLSMMVVMAILLHGRAGHGEGREESWIRAGRNEVNASLSVARLLPVGNKSNAEGNAGWAPGLAVSYGYFATAWLKVELQFQGDLGINDHGFLSGWGLAGASAYFHRGPRLAAFAGLRLGYGAFWEGDSDGGLAQLRPAVVVAPKAGIQLKLTDAIGLEAYLEYQAAFVSTETKYEYGNRQMIRLPVGVVFAF